MSVPKKTYFILTDVFGVLNGLANEYGKILKFWVFGISVLFVRDPKFFESILSSQQVIKKNRLYDLLSSWLGDGLLLSNSSKWHARRKIITPTFHFKILEEFVEVFDQQSSVLVKRIQDKADGKTVLDMFPVICLTALDIIAETAMGVKINAQENPDFPYAKALTRYVKHYICYIFDNCINLYKFKKCCRYYCHPCCEATSSF